MAVKAVLKDKLSALLQLRELPSELLTDLPGKWEKHRDLILLPQSCFKNERWKEIDASIFWATVADCFGAKRLAQKDVIKSDDYRTPQVKMLLGKDSWVCHVDNRIKYNYDITKCMLSIGNISEKLRMAQLNCAGQVVVDMFAGIGYFTLPLLVHAKASHVHACEWNIDAVGALKRNLVANKVSEKCTMYYGDNNKVCPENVAQRIIMGLIPTAMGSIKSACRAVCARTGATMHIHGNVDSHKDTHMLDQPTVSCNRSLKPEWVTWATTVSSVVNSTMQNLHADDAITTDILHIQRVKSYGPRVDHLVLDLKVSINSDGILTT